MEKQVSFRNGSATLRGVIHSPDNGGATGVGIVFLHGWSGCRLGPHRMFVKAARQFAASGHECLRFDFAGRGESDLMAAEASIGSMIADAQAAKVFLASERSVDKVLLLGICSAGKVAVSAAADDPEIEGLILWSAEAMGDLRSRSTRSRKSLHVVKEYLGKLTSRRTWRKILSGQVRTDLVGKALLQKEAPSEEETREETATLKRFRAYKGRILFIYGANDPDTRLAAEAYRKFAARERIDNEFHSIEDANHSFYGLHWEHEVIGITEQWLARHFCGDA